VRHVTIDIAGMSCGNCVAAVRVALSAVPGVSVDSVTIGAATVGYDPTTTTTDDITFAIRNAGYAPATVRDDVQIDAATRAATHTAGVLGLAVLTPPALLRAGAALAK
jgi:copper chaperone